MRATVLLLAAVLWCSSIFAAVPHQINYQGYLTATGGTPVNAPVTMVLNLYNVATGGAPLYTETQTVTVTNGVFNVLIGSGTPLPLAFDAPYWLGVKVGADAEMTPRQPVAASAYAISAARAEALAVTATVPGSQISGAITTATLPAANLAGTIGTTQIGNNAVTQAKLSPVAPPPVADQVLGTDGTSLRWQTVTGGGGTITGVTAGTGLTGGGAGGNVSLALASPLAINMTASGPVLYGENFGGGSGVTGFSAGGYGVIGASTGVAGLRGSVGSASGFTRDFIGSAGVWGDSQNSVGVWGTSGTNVGVAGASASNSQAGVYARGASDAGIALEIAQGAIKVTGAGVNTPTAAFVHVVDAGPSGNTCGDDVFQIYHSVISNPMTDGNPNAIVFTIPTGGRGLTINQNQTISVGYSISGCGIFANVWVVVGNRPFLTGQRFNVLVVKP